jgi:hypothetical protein
MTESLGRFLATPWGGAVRIFVGLLLGYFVLDLQNDGKINVSADDLATWVAAALVVVIPIAIALINPQDERAGYTGGPVGGDGGEGLIDLVVKLLILVVVVVLVIWIVSALLGGK